MKRKTIAEHMRDILIEEETDSVSFWDLDLITECKWRSNMKKSCREPQPMIQYVLQALEKSCLFEKFYISGDHTGQERIYRAFRLKEGKDVNEK